MGGPVTGLIRMVLLAAAAAAAWDCPQCGLSNQGPICRRCSLPEPPPGTVWIRGDTITVDGEVVEVAPFFIDASPVTYRRLLPWLNEEATSLERLAELVSGKADDNMNFLRYTPFTGNEQGTGLAVPSACLDLPACSITWTGARQFLASEGKRLPTTAELALAARRGFFRELDVQAVMSAFAEMMYQAMGSALGRFDAQAMFAGCGTPGEIVIWEWTGDTPSGAGVWTDPCVVIFRTGGTGIASTDSGYFNVAFRGAVSDPSGL